VTDTTEFKHATLAAALAAFQEQLPQIRKGNTAQVKSDKGNFAYDYADLADVSAAVMPLLGSHGLSFSARPTVGDHGFVLFYKLAHESGEWEEGIYPLPSANTPPQQLGSAITYARRYALCAVTGVAPGGDDDDAAAAQSAPPQQAQRRSQPARQQRIAPQKASRDWAAEAAATKTLEALTALATEASEAGEMGVRVGEATVFETLTARKQALEAPPLTEDAGTAAKARNWLRDGRALSTAPEVAALVQEAIAAGAPKATIEELEVRVRSLTPDQPASPEGEWPVAAIPKDADWTPGEALADGVEEVPFG